jgi:hypothetical protein
MNKKIIYHTSVIILVSLAVDIRHNVFPDYTMAHPIEIAHTEYQILSRSTYMAPLSGSFID